MSLSCHSTCYYFQTRQSISIQKSNLSGFSEAQKNFITYMYWLNINELPKIVQFMDTKTERQYELNYIHHYRFPTSEIPQSQNFPTATCKQEGPNNDNLMITETNRNCGFLHQPVHWKHKSSSSSPLEITRRFKTWEPQQRHQWGPGTTTRR